ncbi:hypothetical protein NQ318_023295 [Aromia moschata]|uniref:Uncharacterized protein n=1 Tax=Aromia moschata TaxID=1265417 RepID=A0AAV8XSP3_9CUCU|nr:hypothetical protein NQ318_023295 [Aromia moschata]
MTYAGSARVERSRLLPDGSGIARKLLAETRYFYRVSVKYAKKYILSVIEIVVRQSAFTESGFLTEKFQNHVNLEDLKKI